MAKTKASAAAVAATDRVESVSQKENEPKKRSMLVVPVDMRAEELIALDAKDEVDLVFDPDLMPHIEDEALEQLSHATKRAYFIAYGQSQRRREQEAAEQARQKQAPTLWVNDPLNFAEARRDRLCRPRKGWHQTTCRNDELDQFLSVGYRVIREKKPGSDEEPGLETGEICKVREDEKVTIIAVEIPEEVYHQHLRAVSYRSQVRVAEDPERMFRDFVEKHNMKARTRKQAIKPIVENDPGREVMNDPSTQDEY